MQSAANFTPVLAVIGGLTVAFGGIKSLLGIYRLLTTYIIAKIPNLKKYGEWAGKFMNR